MLTNKANQADQAKHSLFDSNEVLQVVGFGCGIAGWAVGPEGLSQGDADASLLPPSPDP